MVKGREVRITFRMEFRGGWYSETESFQLFIEESESIYQNYNNVRDGLAWLGTHKVINRFF